MDAAILRFPGDRLANFVCSFGAADTAEYTVVGTRGRLRAIQGYEYTQPITLEITVDGRTERKSYEVRDQFAPELIYFSDCILNGKEPEPSGIEGLLDVHIIRSLYESAKEGRPVELKELTRQKRPSLKQNIYRRRVVKPPLVHVKAPSA
jgi:glucose-fructose oxidoreductase